MNKLINFFFLIIIITFFLNIISYYSSNKHIKEINLNRLNMVENLKKKNFKFNGFREWHY